MPKLIIFDLGNTLIHYKRKSLNWSEHYVNALRFACAQCGIVPDDESIEKAVSILSFYNSRIHPRIFEVAESEVLSKTARVFGADAKKFENGFFGYFQRDAVLETTCIETLRSLKNSGYITAVLTDVPYGMPRVLVERDITDIAGYIDILYTSCEIGFRKPDPAGVERLLSETGIPKNNACIVGDEPKDLECAARAGIVSFLLSGEDRDWGQTHIVAALSEVLKFF